VREISFPGESAEYRAARAELLAAEHGLTRHIEAVARMRRALPPGGAVPQDYPFTEGPADLDTDEPVRTTRLSELFGSHGTLLVYNFMYGPEMAEPCPMCTSVLDGLDGSMPDIRVRAGIAVVAKSPIARIRAFARTRGWVNTRLLSSADNTYNRDYHGENGKGEQESMLNVFVRRGEEIRHFYGTEKGSSEPGQDDRHVDLIWPLWNALDLTPDGRGGEWRPSYPPKSVTSVR